MRTGSPDPPALQRMAQALSHRGPDDHGISIIGSVGLVHTRLSIVDPTPTGRQPMTDWSGRFTVSYNGEIYNHAELRRTWLAGRTFRGGADTETLVELLAIRGIGVVPDLRGIFAFAALDTATGTLHLCRDAFGVKPLYYAETPDAIWFASEVGALRAAGVALRPRPDALRHALARRWVNGPVTVYDGVRRVEPGATVSIELRSGDRSVTRWYDPAGDVDPARAAMLASLSREKTTDLVEAELRRAVHRQLMSDVPLGTMCSGGIDSSLLTAFAHEEIPQLKAFNVSITDQPDQDEGPWARAVAEHLGVDLHTIELDREGWLRGLVPAVAHFEYPLSYEASVGLAALSARASAEGVKVLLSGEGADELLGGYPWLHADESAAFFDRDRPLRRSLRRVKRSLRRRAAGDAAGDGSRCAESDAYDAQVLARCFEAYRHHPRPVRQLEARLLSDFRVSLPQILARGDKNTMQHSIEARVPFLDQDLVALCVNLPLEHRIEPARKNPLVVLAERHLPAGISSRPKIGFNFDVSSYLAARARPGFLAEGMLRDLLGVDGPAWTSQVALDPHRGAMLLWTSEIWARLFIGGQSEADVVEDMFGSVV